MKHIQAKDSSKWQTAVRLAAEQGHEPTVDALLSLGFDCLAPNTDLTKKQLLLAALIEFNSLSQTDVLEFEHLPVRAWRYDTEQNKWTGRGTGQVVLYWDKVAKLGKIVFLDESHDDQLTLLQWINGNGPCEYCPGIIANENVAEGTKLGSDQLQWVGADYTIDKLNPMIGKWKLNFMGDKEAASNFMNIFNDKIQKCNTNHIGTSDYIFKPYNKYEHRSEGRTCLYIQHICIGNRFESKSPEELMLEDRTCGKV